MTTIGTTNIKFSEIYNAINDPDHNGTDNIAISDFRGTGYVGGTVPNTGAISIGTHFKNKNFNVVLYPFSSHTFESCASSVADTRMGPTLANCISEYGANSPWNNTAFFNVVSGIQEWTVPETGVYTISATGASGGHYSLGSNITEPGGYGAVITGNFTLTRGDKIKILVGRKGDRKRATQWTSGGGGGGGTFVLKSPYNSVDSVLVVAGGGGGNHDWNVTTRYVNGGQTSLTVSTNGGVGNINGWGSGGGGGLIGDGSPSAALPGGGGALSGAGGKSFINGGIGGVGGYNSTSAYYYYNNHGGFGGGGGNGLYAGGGGGGMSGGATTIRNYSPYMGSYGGGSYNTGTSQSASSSIVGVDGADGEVIITLYGANIPENISVIQNYGAHDIAYINCTSVTDFNNRTFLGYISKFGVTGTSTNNDSTQWQNGYSGTSATPISYDAKPLKSGNDYFLDNGDYGLRFIHGDGSADGPDWCVIDFGPLNNGDFDGLYQNTKGRFFGGENTASGGGGGIYTSSSNKGMLWGFNDSDGWKLLYQLPLGVRDSNYNKSTGKWFTSGGTYVTSGDGKRAEYDTMVLTHVGFSVGTP